LGSFEEGAQMARLSSNNLYFGVNFRAFVRTAGLIATCFILVSISVSGQVIDLAGKWKFKIGDDDKWALQYFNDSNWESITVPSAWEDEGFNGYDGFAWYRTRFDGSSLNKNETYYLNLGFIDDADEVYLNGTLIGLSGIMPPKFKTAYNNERRYILLSHLINYTGSNTIAIRVFDAMLAGGIVDGRRIGIYRRYRDNNLLVDLQGVWSFAISRSGKPVTDNRAWQNIMVPSPWEHQGHFKYDGYAWYRKTFELPPDSGKEPLILLLGLIDDFDEVYLNGKFIGETNDHRPYGSSRSWEQKRAYPIPENTLRRKGENVIEVLVHDMGNAGGIYDGTVGIATKSAYERHYR